MLGFFIGKQSMFNEDKARSQKAQLLYARRDIVPQDGQSIPTLSLASSQGIKFDSPQPVNGSAAPGATILAGASPQAAQAMLPALAPAGMSREQIAALCGGQGLIDPRLRSLCFYSQGS